jgi:hypothetical protein
VERDARDSEKAGRLCHLAPGKGQRGGDVTRDPERFARDYIPTLRSWTESTFLGALSQSRPLDERERIIDRYYGTYQTLVRENPVGHGMGYVHAYITIAKIGP